MCDDVESVKPVALSEHDITLIELPNSPLYRASKFVPDATSAVSSSVRVTYNALLYPKKLAAEKNDC